MNGFVRATEPKGKVHWINLDHVRQMTVEPGVKGGSETTAICIDNWLVEKRLVVVETPEQLLGQLR